MESLFNEPLSPKGYASLEDIVRPEACELPEYKWFVLRITYARAEKAEKIISQYDMLTFLPMEYKSYVKDGVKHWTKKPCTPSMLFVYGKYADVLKFTHRAETGEYRIEYVDFTFDHTRKNEFGRDEIMTIPFKQMQNFIRVILAAVPHSYSVTPQEIHYRPGGLVRITQGEFKGVTGRVARIHSQQRVVVSIEGVLNFATTYIPKHYLEPIEEEEEQ
jgi:transcription antitermination factor NusG